MSRYSMYFKAAVCTVFALPVPLFAKGVTGQPYQPHYMTSVEEASNRVQFLSPHFIPLNIGQKAVSLTTGYSLERLSENKLGLNLFFTKSGVQQKTQYFWAWNGGYDAPVSTPYKSDRIISIVYEKIESFEIWHFPWTKGNRETWCVVPVVANGPTSNGKGLKSNLSGSKNGVGGLNNNVACVTSEADAQEFADALATLTVARGNTLSTASGINVAQLQQQVTSLSPKDAASPSATSVPAANQSAPSSGVRLGIHVRAVTESDVTALGLPKPKGVVVTSVEKGGLADEMQMQAGDVIVEVNGSEIGDVDFFTQFVRSGAARTFRVWRRGQTLDVTVPQSL